ncbi:hypothetical protein MWN52_18045 [Pseudoxanthomonas winnipegensis]|uniref:RHS repeat protein n=1 Tax=Pseudoxanthomonas winnipegensis TaxID=2480810 RepID=UPI0025790759|nr:RHS repeat protein [Pseudoxanthomonas winnipegensis]WJI15477.1 hypothetical protein MWN52_18045 [Pseudoxanthomonas winnipegensis]
MKSSRRWLIALPIVTVMASLSCGVHADTRVEVISYADNLQKWILGPVSQFTVNGSVVTQRSFNAASQPVEVKSFGLVVGSYTYNADGTMSSSKDGNGHATTYTSWKRGIPQAITYADGKSQAATVNDQGWATAEVDQNGYRTEYAYDSLGRITLIKPPAEDSGTWNNTSHIFERIATDEFGVASGHWRKSTNIGNLRKIVVYDAFWRPVVTQEYDAANQAATQRFQRFAYDAEGRQVFISYPSSSSSVTSGIWKSYDALGRLKSSSQDGEGGTLTTLTEYLTGNMTRTTDPLGHKVVTSFQAFDTPSYETPVVVEAQEGAKTTIARDVFGKPTSISRTKPGS